MIHIKKVPHDQTYQMEATIWSHDVKNIFYWRKRNVFSILAKQTPEYLDSKLEISLNSSFLMDEFDFRGF